MKTQRNFVLLFPIYPFFKFTWQILMVLHLEYLLCQQILLDMMAYKFDFHFELSHRQRQ